MSFIGRRGKIPEPINEHGLFLFKLSLSTILLLLELSLRPEDQKSVFFGGYNLPNANRILLMLFHFQLSHFVSLLCTYVHSSVFAAITCQKQFHLFRII